MSRIVPGIPHEASWKRAVPRRSLPAQVLTRVIDSALPHHHVLDIQPLAGGLRNANFKVHLSSASEPLVLRIYEHDQSLRQKKIDLFRLLSDLVPVPEVIHAEPCGLEEIPPFILARYVEGVTFLELKRNGDTEAIAQAAFSAGEILAGVGRIRFPKPGWLGPGLAVTAPLLEGADVIPRFLDLCLASVNLRKRMPEDLRHCTHVFAWSWAARLAGLEHEIQLVHGDFNRRNLVLQCVAGRWRVAACSRLGVCCFRLSSGRSWQLSPLRTDRKTFDRATSLKWLLAWRRYITGELADPRAPSRFDCFM